ncbi:hypothetical protein U14_05777 [Candidatus Moduliflexus flocculans]|uniref:Flavodoxin-like domain-containing protein n=1 Tax=Candidatus Moduliflexus flocculans TaxID=1499966 RepID=A0A081BSW0_9BACT|nr:hypothetical protein U14_05777 [Candidatus Moduliflexus flocculans]
MKVAILYSPKHQKLEESAKFLGRALEEQGHRAELLPFGQSDRSHNLRSYDFLYLGSVAEGIIGSKIPADVVEALKPYRGLEGIHSGAFLLKSAFGFGNTKGLTRLMGLLESQGSIVMDFQLIQRQSDCTALAKRLKR